MRAVWLERRDPARNVARFYAITVAPTLFGPWVLVREWGRIGQPGTVREARRPTPSTSGCGGRGWCWRRRTSTTTRPTAYAEAVDELVAAER
jgi:hypothetical protein